MKLFPNGDRVFEVISRYDDLVTLEEREDYEPGDTLALILPFLVLHNISDKDIAGLAAKASFTGGAEKLVSWLQSKSWKVFCITTTYEPYARHLTQKLGIYNQHVACTIVPWEELRLTPEREELDLIKQAEADILTMKPADDDDRIKQSLDRFFREELPATRLGEIIKKVKPMGGRRKLAALSRFADKYDLPLSGWVAVGDSITDFRMLEAVNGAGGLAIAFNANEYALPYATMSLAATSIDNLVEVLEAYKKNRLKDAEKVVRWKERGGSEARGYLHWLAGREDLDEVVSLHKNLRRLVREEAGKLG
ncbi:MAG: HAD hydrolase family protein [Dehalococcoidales bacterium]|nr:HAD hydrolase family protein [Dehalococcoidales bacterium]